MLSRGGGIGLAPPFASNSGLATSSHSITGDCLRLFLGHGDASPAIADFLFLGLCIGGGCGLLRAGLTLLRFC